jgi:copper chaperone CopZ
MTVRKDTIALENVSCNGCFWEIQVCLEELDGFISMSYDIPTKTIAVEYDPQRLTRTAIESKIEEVGFFLKDKAYEQVGFWQAIRRAFSRR